MIISGKNSVYEALNSGRTVIKVLISSSIHSEFSQKIINLCKEKNVRFDFAQKKQLDKLSSHHQGFVCYVTDFKYSTVDEILQNKKQDDNFIVLLDGIQDPHNFGSIIRACECAGVDGIIIENRRSCDVNETVYKTSCGAINYVKIAKVTNINDVIKYLQKNNVWVYCAEAGGESLYKTNLKANIAIVMGSEGFGVGTLTKKICDQIISLPLNGSINSLNVSNATTAIIYEALRQRQIN